MAAIEGNYAYMTIAEIVKIYGWSRSYAYKRAHLDGWRRFLGRDRLIRYHRVDVDQSVPDADSRDGVAASRGSMVKLKS